MEKMQNYRIEKLGKKAERRNYSKAVSYTHLRAHETGRNLVCRLLLEKKKSLSLIHISEPTRLGMISYADFCLKQNRS